MIRIEDKIDGYNEKLLIKKILIHIKKKKSITEYEFNEIARNNGYRTRFNGNGCGKLALMNYSNCWMKKYQNYYGPIIKYVNGKYLVTIVWMSILDRTNI